MSEYKGGESSVESLVQEPSIHHKVKMSVSQRTLEESEKTTHIMGTELCKSYKGLVSRIYKGLF